MDLNGIEIPLNFANIKMKEVIDQPPLETWFGTNKYLRIELNMKLKQIF